MSGLSIPQGPQAYPLIGNLFDLQDGLHNVMPKLVAQYGGFFSAKFPSGVLSQPLEKLGGPTVLISDPELLEEMYNRHGDFNKKLFKYSQMRSGLGGNGLFTSDDDEPIHDQAARILLPAFSLQGMKEYFEIITTCTDVLSKVFSEHASEGRLLELHPLLSAYTFEVISRVGFGKEFNAMTEPCEFLDMLDEFSTISARMKAKPFKSQRMVSGLLNGDVRHIKAVQARMKSFIEKLIGEKKAAVGTKESRCPMTGASGGGCPMMKDMAERMLTTPDPQTGETLPDSNVANQVATFLVAGHDSTSTAITMLLYKVAQHPEVEEKVYQEVMSVCGYNPITWDALGKMTYCTQVVKESLRMYAPASQFMKSSPVDRATHLGPYEIPPGTTFVVSTWGLHYNPQVYEKPEKFDPERWSPENASKRSPYAWLPFSYGKRACIGMQLSLIEQRMALAEMVRRFHLRVDLSTRLTTTVPLFLNPQGIFLKVSPRSQSMPGQLAPPQLAPEPSEGAEGLEIGRHEQLAGKQLLVLFGSNMGTCEDFADRMVRRGQAMGLSCSKAALDAVCDGQAPVALPKGDEGLVLVVTSTYNGQPPDNARGFDEWLDTSAAAERVQGARFAVFGCGNRQWAATYMAFAQRVHDAFESLGGDCLAPFGEGDMDSGDAEFNFARWDLGVCIALLRRHRIPVPEDIKEALYPKLPEYHSFLWTGMRLQDLKAGAKLSVAKTVNHRAQAAFLKGNTAWNLEVLCNRELVASAQGRSTRHIEMRLPEGVQYQAGDHLGVLGANPNKVVLAYLDRLQVAHDAVYKIELEGGESLSFLPLGHPVGAYQLLAWFVELQGVATRVQLRALSKLAAEEGERARLVELSEWNEDEEKADAYEDHVKRQRRTVLEILEEFPSVEPTLGQLLGLLPVNKPRFYSISSSPLFSPNVASVTVSVVNGTSPAGRKHLGLCSNHLKDFPKQLPASVHPSHAMLCPAFVKDTGSTFRLPRSADTPIIMVGPGTGVAPMRGFIQHRVASEAKENVLFFGCRDEGEYLYREELESWSREGVLELHVAFSRAEGQPKAYVQQLVETEGARVAQLAERGAHIYVCGDASKMAPDVRAAFARVFASAGMGEDYVERMADEGRYCQDVWAAQSF